MERALNFGEKSRTATNGLHVLVDVVVSAAPKKGSPTDFLVRKTATKQDAIGSLFWRFYNSYSLVFWCPLFAPEPDRPLVRNEFHPMNRHDHCLGLRESLSHSLSLSSQSTESLSRKTRNDRRDRAKKSCSETATACTNRKECTSVRLSVRFRLGECM